MTAQIDLERLNGGPEPKQEPVNIEVVPEARELLRPEQATLLEPADIMVDKAQERAVFRTTRMTNEHGKPQEVASVGIMQDSMGEWFIMPRGTRSGDTAHDITISDQHSLHLPRGMEVLVVDGQATFRTAEGNEKTDPSFLSDPTV